MANKLEELLKSLYIIRLWFLSYRFFCVLPTPLNKTFPRNDLKTQEITSVHQYIALIAFVCFSDSVRFKSFKRKYLTASYTISSCYFPLCPSCVPQAIKWKKKITDLHSAKVWLDTRYCNSHAINEIRDWN